jgi:hypothetical protein
MSALLVDDLIVPLPTRSQSEGWRHVEREDRARPHLVAVPEPTRVSGQASPMRLTDRGLAVIVVFFLALVATAAVVLVTSFLGVSNEPIPAPGPQSAQVASRA